MIHCSDNNFRYDYENCDVSGANLMMTFIESQMQAFIGQKFTANEKSFIVKQADNFAYTDPVDNSVSQKQVRDSNKFLRCLAMFQIYRLKFLACLSFFFSSFISKE